MVACAAPIWTPTTGATWPCDCTRVYRITVSEVQTNCTVITPEPTSRAVFTLPRSRVPALFVEVRQRVDPLPLMPRSNYSVVPSAVKWRLRRQRRRHG
jgi:hypothetical protein